MRKRNMLTQIGIISAAVILLFTACSNPYKEQYDHSGSNLGQRNADEPYTVGNYRAYGYTHKGKNHHNNTKMHISPDTATKLSQMEGIHIAHVLVTDRNAYVAIVLNASATGTLESGTPHSSFGHRDGRPFVDRGGVKTETDPPFTTPDEKNISSKLKQKIALKVRELNPHVTEVFISADENFNTLLGRYNRLQWMGESLDSYVQEFNETVEQFFPLPKNIR